MSLPRQLSSIRCGATAAVTARTAINARNTHAHATIDALFAAADLSSSTSTTKAGWCLREGLMHIALADDDNNAMLSLIQQHGIPTYFSCCSSSNNSNSTTDKNKNKRTCRHDDTLQKEGVHKNPSNCFESLCRTVVGQFVSGVSAMAAWKRLLAVADNKLTPDVILTLTKDDDIESNLQKPAGLTKAKAACLVDLARHFADGSLSEDFFATAENENEIRKALLKVRGIGPWSCDIFLQFYLERPNILPLGDLGVRKGLAKHFSLVVDSSKNHDEVTRRLNIYAPYHSLVTYYMWRVADTPDPLAATASPKKRNKTLGAESSPSSSVTPVANK